MSPCTSKFSAHKDKKFKPAVIEVIIFLTTPNKHFCLFAHLCAYIGIIHRRGKTVNGSHIILGVCAMLLGLKCTRQMSPSLLRKYRNSYVLEYEKQDNNKLNGELHQGEAA